MLQPQPRGGIPHRGVRLESLGLDRFEPSSEVGGGRCDHDAPPFVRQYASHSAPHRWKARSKSESPSHAFVRRHAGSSFADDPRSPTLFGQRGLPGEHPKSSQALHVGPFMTVECSHDSRRPLLGGFVAQQAHFSRERVTTHRREGRTRTRSAMRTRSRDVATRPTWETSETPPT